LNIANTAMTSTSQSVLILLSVFAILLGIYYLTQECFDCVHVPIQTIKTRDYKTPAAKPTEGKYNQKQKLFYPDDDDDDDDDEE